MWPFNRKKKEAEAIWKKLKGESTVDDIVNAVINNEMDKAKKAIQNCLQQEIHRELAEHLSNRKKK